MLPSFVWIGCVAPSFWIFHQGSMKWNRSVQRPKRTRAGNVSLAFTSATAHILWFEDPVSLIICFTIWSFGWCGEDAFHFWHFLPDSVFEQAFKGINFNSNKCCIIILTGFISVIYHMIVDNDPQYKNTLSDIGYGLLLHASQLQ